MNVEVINTGTELLLGDIVNTSFQYLSRTLNDAGFNVLYQTTIGDNGDRLLEALSIALERADIIITTGGLGPTRGDITKEMVARKLHLPLVPSAFWLDKLTRYFAARHVVMTENNKKQAMIPEGAVVFNNDVGTAPGVGVWTPDHKLIVMLPGPPAETTHVFSRQVMPYLRKSYAAQGIIHSRVLHLRGLTESMVAEKLDGIIMAQTNPTIALYARKGEIIIRITAKSDTLEKAEAMNRDVEEKIRAILGSYIYGVDYETLPEALGKRLKEKNLTIAFAESCTGGLASSLVTDIPGSSEYLMGSVVSYTNDVKHRLLGVKTGNPGHLHRRQRTDGPGNGPGDPGKDRNGSGHQHHRHCRPRGRNPHPACRSGVHRCSRQKRNESPGMPVQGSPDHHQTPGGHERTVPGHGPGQRAVTTAFVFHKEKS